MRMDLKQNKIIIGTVAGCALGGLIVFFVRKYFNKKSVLAVDESKSFDIKKDKVMDMVETARKKFNEKVHYPVKENIKSMIHNHNHNVKASTKPITG